MNKKEQTILIFLCLTFLIGAGISFIKHYSQQKRLEQIVIRYNDTTGSTQTKKTDTEEFEDALININTASSKELEALSGIGPVLAQRIVEYRMKNGPYKSKEDLLKVSGIGPKRFADLKDKITVK